VWDILKVADASNLATFRLIPIVAQALGSASDEEVLATLEGLRQSGPVAREPLRTAEFRQLVAARPETPGELPGPTDLFFARAVTPAGGPPPKIARLVLLPKLREVRAQIGFTRLEPAMPDLEGEFNLEVQSAPLTLTQDWLPATEIRGEGIFLQLDERAVWEWEQRPEVLARERALHAGYQDWLRTLKEEARRWVDWSSRAATCGAIWSAPCGWVTCAPTIPLAPLTRPAMEFPAPQKTRAESTSTRRRWR
jgi:hypothetical protein